MTIWLVNIFDEWPAEGEYPGRMVSLLGALVGRGHEVVWWSSDWSHRYKRRRVSRPEVQSGYRLIALPTLSYGNNTGVRRLLSHRAWARSFLEAARRRVDGGTLGKPTCIVVNLPPPSMGAAVARLRAEWGGGMVVDIRDSWPENFIQLLPFRESWNRLLAPLLLAPFRRAARQAYQSADGISAVSGDYLEVASRYGVRGGRVFPIGCPADRFAGVPRPWKGRMGPFRLVYSGSMSRSYDLETLLRALVLLKDHPVELHFAGLGDAVERLRQLSEVLGVASRVVFHGMLNQYDLRALLENCHLGMNAVWPASGIAMPNKLGDYWAAGLPVAHSLESGELARLIRDRDLGVTYHAGSPESLSEVLAKCLLPSGRDHLKAQSQRAHEYASEHLDRRRIYPEFARWIESVARA